MQDPLVSILIPFKNTTLYLPECLDAIQNQTYAKWEILAVDDHSSDASFKLVSSYARKDPRIKVYKNSGNGIIAALRTAYQESKGIFITRMDSDDVMVPEKLETMTTALLENGKGSVALGLVRYFSHRGISNGYARYEAWLKI